MDTLTELIEYIVKHNKLGGEDVDIFRHILPGSCEEGIVVAPYGGLPTPTFCESSEKHFQIAFVGTSRKKTYNRALAVYKSLRPVNTPYIQLETMNCPISIGAIPTEAPLLNNKNKIRYVINITITSLN